MKQIKEMSRATHEQIISILTTVIENYCKIDLEKYDQQGQERETKALMKYHRKDLKKIIKLLNLNEDENFKTMITVLIRDIDPSIIEIGMIRAIIHKSTQMLQEKDLKAFVGVLFSIGAYLRITDTVNVNYN